MISCNKPHLELWISNVNMEYAYGQMKLSEMNKIFVYYRLLKEFYGLADTPTFFKQQVDETLNMEFPEWLDDIIIVTRRKIEENRKEVEQASSRLQNAGYRANARKTKILRKRNRMSRPHNK